MGLVKGFRKSNHEDLETAAETFVRSVDTPSPSSRLRDYGMQRIMARAEDSANREQLLKTRIYRNPSLTHRIVLVGMMIPLLFILLTSSAYAFSSGAQPGSTLYGTKLFFERTRESLTLSAENDIELEIAYSDRRISELEKMSDPGNNQGLDRWLHEYLLNIDKAYTLLDRVPAEDAEWLSQLLLVTFDNQAAIMNEIRNLQAAPVKQIDEAYGACSRGRDQMRQRHGGNPMGGSQQGSGQGSGSGSEKSGGDINGGGQMNQGDGEGHMPQGSNQGPGAETNDGMNGHMQNKSGGY